MTSHRYPALIELLRTAETLWNSSRLLFARWDLSPSQFNVMNLLHGLPEGMSQIDLSRALLMHRSNLTGLVDRLEARGLVRRRAAPKDRRAYRVLLTPDGQKLMGEIVPHYRRAADQVWGDLSEERASQLQATLERLCLNAQKLAETFAQIDRRVPNAAAKEGGSK
jgi:DNA-binding MarR family transcriptional regulator